MCNLIFGTTITSKQRSYNMCCLTMVIAWNDSPVHDCLAKAHEPLLLCCWRKPWDQNCSFLIKSSRWPAPLASIIFLHLPLLLPSPVSAFLSVSSYHCQYYLFICADFMGKSRCICNYESTAIPYMYVLKPEVHQEANSFPVVFCNFIKNVDRVVLQIIQLPLQSKNDAAKIIILCGAHVFS